MTHNVPSITRRSALQASVGLAAASLCPGAVRRALGFESANERPRIGVIGCGVRWDKRVFAADGRYGVGKEFPKFGDIISVCDVDANRLARAKDIVQGWLGKAPDSASDYRKIIDDPRVDVVHISTPDHWHAKIAIEAMLAGKDVYCEKPMTLTIDEGRLLCEACRKTGAVMQVGTQQRSAPQFVKAIAMIRDGRLGKLVRVLCGIGGAPVSPEIPVATPPRHFDWDRWLGPAPRVDYRFQAGAPNIIQSWSRTHYEFRWWYEYSGGKLTDWGAHHVDIATWGMDKTDTGPISVDPIMVEHPVEFQDGYPKVDNAYNTATKFHIKAIYHDGVELILRHDTDNGILFEGTEGRIFVNRGKLVGKPVEDLASNPLPDGAMEAVYKGRELTDHVANFFAAVASRQEPISDVFSHHRALTTCHLAGIAARVGRKIRWDPDQEQVIGDPLAQSLVAREKRQRFEIEM
ncbi:Gfo/Idh/MocA family protein [Lignipirellula cremea]|uniref:Glucose--fructose oxidoreductase n=1 Tax=Lignipirellula cremea TaxID=2528010 RepID=A0A518DKU2_9BACT|nr:Gfo/Idh/MocA family oxidoreductase [Lignipirellula cremea]QDU92458.1 Glucose--fructose oxidoreductase precursor [Lignipirellula cremea]